MKKKFLSICLALCMAVSCFILLPVVSAASGTTVEFSTEDKSATFGHEVSVPIKVKTSGSASMLGCNVTYDSEVLTFERFEYASAQFAENDVTANKTAEGKILFYLVKDLNSFDGTVINLIFSCPEDTENSEQIITEIGFEFVNKKCYDEEYEELPQDNVSFAGGKITIQKPHPASSFELAIEGEAKAGGELRAVVSNFSDAWELEPEFQYKWKIDGSIAGTGETYVPAASAVGKQVTLEVTSTVGASDNPSTTVSALSDIVVLQKACGDNLTLTFDGGTLKISGTGEMADFDGDTPWRDFQDAIESIVIEDGVTSISEAAFRDCYNLSGVTISGSVKSIGVSAFEVCRKLKSVTLSEGLESIGDFAFSDCESLGSITIPDSVTSIGDGAFNFCNLDEINISENNPAYMLQDNILFDKDKTILICCITGKSGAYEIPGTVKRIGTGAFYGSPRLASVIIPDGLTSIGDNAFYRCEDLEEIIIPDSVCEIGKGAFSGTAWFYNQPDGVVYAGKVAYCYSGSMPENCEIVLEDGTVSIADYAFEYEEDLEGIIIPDSVTVIGNSAFTECENLITVELGNGVTVIGNNAFAECYSLSSVELGNNVTVIGDGAFMDCGLWGITIPDSVKKIGWRAFSSCEYLENVVLGNGIENIDSRTFERCTALSKIVIPDSVINIGERAFGSCGNLRAVVMGENVKTIEWSAFGSCPVEDVYYKGTREMWDSIDIARGNNELTGANIIFVNDGESALGEVNSCYYNDGSIVTEIDFLYKNDCCDVFMGVFDENGNLKGLTYGLAGKEDGSIILSCPADGNIGDYTVKVFFWSNSNKAKPVGKALQSDVEE